MSAFGISIPEHKSMPVAGHRCRWRATRTSEHGARTHERRTITLIAAQHFAADGWRAAERWENLKLDDLSNGEITELATEVADHLMPPKDRVVPLPKPPAWTRQ